VTAATESYRYNSDKIAQVVEDCLTPDPNGEARTQAVYDHYKGWCHRNGLKTENQRNFKQGLMKVAEVVRRRPRDDDGSGNVTTLLLGFTLPHGGYYEQKTLWE
jgi:phage/plasmid-associated DNA primase